MLPALLFGSKNHGEMSHTKKMMTEKSYGNGSDINKLFNGLMGKIKALKSLTKMTLSVQF